MLPLVPRPVVVVSNRGPLSFERGENDQLTSKRGAGGLVGALGPAVASIGATWIAAATSEDDRLAASRGLTETDGYHLRLLTIDDRAWRAYYDTISNSTLWYLYHGLFDAVRRPLFDRHWRAAWDRYREVNEQFARAVVETAPKDSFVLVHDYHLSLVGAIVAKERPDVRTVHFHHTPFARPDELRMLPDDVSQELLTGLTAFGSCGFHTKRWAGAFTASCETVLGSVPSTFVSPAAANLDEVREVSASADAARASDSLHGLVGDRRLIVRNDRMELSKNILRGFLAFDELLATRPEWRGKVVFAAYVYPSRQTLADYLGYRAEVESLVERLNARWSTGDGWTPIVLSTEDDFPGAMAALRAADVLLVNPVRDGLNLVAKEGVSINERDAVLVLSRESGVWDELGEWSLGVNPFDVGGTADALHRALSMDADDRSSRAAALRAAASARTPHDWYRDQLDAAT